jgi:hypothetical protein
MDMIRRSGWTEDRKVDVKSTLAALEDLNYYVGPIAEDILSSFSGLLFKFPSGSPIRFDIDGNWCRARTNKNTATAVSRLVNEPVCRIATGDLSDIFVTESGRILILDMEWFSMAMANNISECLDALSQRFPASRLETSEIPAEQRYYK